MSRTVFINCGIGLWYSKGSERLRASLLQHGFPGDILIWKNWPEVEFPRSNIYNCKAASMLQAMQAGYTTIIWADSSIQALENTQSFVDEINTTGYWIGQSGYNAAETASDAQLQYFGVSRDWAQNVPDCATGLFGFNIENPVMLGVVETWIQAARDGAFSGSRKHDGQSKDKRFKFCRQDQSAMSLILGKNGIPLKRFSDRGRFKWDTYPAMFHCEGM